MSLFFCFFHGCIDGSFLTHVCKLDVVTQNLEKKYIYKFVVIVKRYFEYSWIMEFVDQGILNAELN